jgi:exopolysaccharide biosynthesis polyprenyl glycosylphosphotransferase
MRRELALVQGEPHLDLPGVARRPERRTTLLPALRRITVGTDQHILIGFDIAVLVAIGTVARAPWPTILVWTAAFALALAATGRYRPRLRYGALDSVPAVLISLAWVVVAAAFLTLPGALVPGTFSRYPVLWLAVAVVGLVAGRTLGSWSLAWRRTRSAGLPTLVVGSGEVAVRLAEVLGEERRVGLAPIGLVGPAPVLPVGLPAPLVGTMAELDAVIETHQPRVLVVAFPGVPDAELVSVLRRCRCSGIAVYVVPRLFDLAVSHPGAELVGGIPLVRLRAEPGNRRRRTAKRLLDITGALIGLAVLAPVLGICALAVRWESGRAGILFRQRRIGRSGKPFTILKFRSLTPSSSEESQVRWSIADDNRVGPVGRVLRGTSLDELPQLINVLRGDMSLVGPRPERPFFVEQFERTYEGYANRHRVPVGITGWAQIHGLRGDTSIEERTRYDNYYVENWSLGLDAQIILRTIASMANSRRR